MHSANSSIVAFMLFLASAQAFGGISSSRNTAFVQSASTATTPTTRLSMSSALDGLNRDMLNNKDDDDDDEKPMTRAEMLAIEKEMKAEMKRLKDEAAAAAEKDE